MVEELFKKLNFNVKVHEDLDVPTLEKALLTESLVNHENYDAFACVIMTHGRLGELYASDARAVRILDFVEYFTNQHCSSLAGKPKMFFIQACQTG
jgi:caspase 7